MGKSSKKSTPKVDAAPAVTPASKSAKKGKREAEEAVEKLVSAKKQKIDDGLKQAVKKEKVEVKTQKKKKKAESSSSDDSSSEEEQKAKVVTKNLKAAKPPVRESSSEESSSDDEDAPKAPLPLKKKQTAAKDINPPVEESSSEEDSSSDEEPHAKAPVPPKKPQVDAKNGSVKGKADSTSSDSSDDEDEKPVKQSSQTKKLPETGSKKAPASHEDSSDSSESDSSSDDEAELPTKASASKIVPQGVSKKKAESSDSSDSDSDEEKDTPVKTLPKKVVLSATNKKVDSSESSDDSDSDESSDSDEGATAQATTTPLNGKASKKSDVKDSSESESDHSDSDSDDDAPAAKPAVGSKQPSSAAQTKELKQNKMDLDEDDSEDDSSEESDEEPPKNKKLKVTTQKESKADESSSDSLDDEEESDDEEPKKKETDVEMVDAATPKTTSRKADFQSSKKAPKTPATPEVRSTGSKTLFVGNLPWEVERADVENFFGATGEVVDVRFALDKDQRFRGFGHVEFATHEAALEALKLNGQSLNGRPVKLDLAHERGERAPYTPYSGKENNSFQKSAGGQSQKIFVRGFDESLGEDEIRSTLGEHFKSCGEVIRISIPTDYETGAVKGIAYLEFKDVDGFNKALELNGSELGEQYLTVEEAKPPRSENRDGWGSGRGGRSSGGRSGGRDGGGRFGGRGGGGGSGGRFGGRGGGGGRFGGRGAGGGGGRFGGRGRASNKPSMISTGKKTTFNDDE